MVEDIEIPLPLLRMKYFCSCYKSTVSKIPCGVRMFQSLTVCNRKVKNGSIVTRLKRCIYYVIIFLLLSPNWPTQGHNIRLFSLKRTSMFVIRTSICPFSPLPRECLSFCGPVCPGTSLVSVTLFLFLTTSVIFQCICIGWVAACIHPLR